MHKKRINSWKQKMARLRGLYLLSFLMVFMFLAVFAGCKTSSNGAAAISSESDQSGEVLVSLSDAQGDFVTYTTAWPDAGANIQTQTCTFEPGL